MKQKRMREIMQQKMALLEHEQIRAILRPPIVVLLKHERVRTCLTQIMAQVKLERRSV